MNAPTIEASASTKYTLAEAIAIHARHAKYLEAESTKRRRALRKKLEPEREGT